MTIKVRVQQDGTSYPQGHIELSDGNRYVFITVGDHEVGVDPKEFFAAVDALKQMEYA